MQVSGKLACVWLSTEVLSSSVPCPSDHPQAVLSQAALATSCSQSLLIIVTFQVNSEFQAFKHIESLGRGELMRASRPLEVTVAVYPTLVLTNALPYDMDIVVWQVIRCPCLCREAMLPTSIYISC